MVAFLFLGSAAHTPAQFVGYFDHVRGAGTHQYSLVFRADISGSSGLFTNIASGVATPVTLTATSSGTGNPITTGSLAAEPAPGTPAYNTFNGFVTFGTNNNNNAIQVPVNTFLTYTFSNLNPNARYNFKGTAVRGGPTGLTTNYTNRWTKITIVGADAATPNHTANVVTSAQEPLDLGPDDVALQTGVNNLPGQGDMAVWDDIVPGSDGMFQIVCTRFTGALPYPNSATLNNPPYAYAIAGIRLEEITTPPAAVAITSGPSPASSTIAQGELAAFTVQVTGTSPRFQWFRPDGNPITHAINTNTESLVLTNAQPADSATYRVRVFNTVNSVTSDPCQLTVNADLTPPVVVYGLGWLDGTNFLVSLSEPLRTTSPLSQSLFHLSRTEGGGNLPISGLSFTNSTNVFISTSAAREPNVNYSITLDANAVTDLNGNGCLAAATPLSVQVALLQFENTPWKYNSDGMDFGVDPFIDPGFDDSAWSNGLSVFDGKTPQPPGRSTVAGFNVATQLPLTNAVYPSTSMVIPTYYYRTHFKLATTPDHVTSLKLQTLVDDFDDFYLNQQEVWRNPGYPVDNPPPAFGYAGGTAVGTAAVVGPLNIPPQALIAGDNIAAVIVNQVNGTSSDSTFAYELIATVDRFADTGPRLTISRNPGSGVITLTWPTQTGAQLYEAITVDAAGVGVGGWQLVATATDGFYEVTPPASGPSQRFYTLRR